MARWSLRTKLVAVAVLALLPVLTIAGWRSYDDARNVQARRADAAHAIVEVASGRQREVLEGSRRLLVAACDDDAVRAVLDATATATELDRCEAYLARLLRRFAADYSALVVTDEKGMARCASSPVKARECPAASRTCNHARERRGSHPEARANRWCCDHVTNRDA